MVKQKEWGKGAVGKKKMRFPMNFSKESVGIERLLERKLHI